MRIAIYPGSFDPVTYAHLDIARRATRIFDRVIMAVFDRPQKKLLFSTAERLHLLRVATADLERVEAMSYETLTVDFARQVGACAIVRGLRAASDFEAEFQMAQVNQAIDPGIEVVVLMAGRQFAHISSTAVREMASLGRDPVEFAPPVVVAALRDKFAQRG
ncbi:pantetheine-phosphate adenylyltransferase [Chloroflexus sp. MS-CIW-1]|jgi:pantetheine-phosphate adenylyltransferase|uniref:pantetheine-phosphate adenylyltransferase n=1 Tax=unclassified Chloroflexus TaxID=2633855 RepID=UPI0004DF47B8|nr:MULTISPECIES: pantetheine-phosphate adenylyltransferase [unclassified Chloroflexus]MBO9349015.1 pantetheine-phosphate adenylyltransferase [Chloroflexus sp.]MDN5270730.1 pantetheine-phosphate adenylyltransferase [Chloroflexus sp. MS-CIW-1]